MAERAKGDDDPTTPAVGADGERSDVDGLNVAGLGNVLFGVWLVSRATTSLLDQALAPSGLDADEFGVYSVLASGQDLTPTDLARWMAAPTTTVSSYLKRFEGRGHIRRRPNPNDGRSSCIELTAAGRRAHREAGARFLPILEQVEAALATASDADATEATIQLRAIHRAVGLASPDGR